MKGWLAGGGGEGAGSYVCVYIYIYIYTHMLCLYGDLIISSPTILSERSLDIKKKMLKFNPLARYALENQGLF